MNKIANKDHERIANADANVNHPAHYQKMVIFGEGFESLDIIQAILDGVQLPPTPSGYLFNILKYVLRFPYKHPDNPIEDLNKARFYCSRLHDYQQHFPFKSHDPNKLTLRHQFSGERQIDVENLIDELVHSLSDRVSFVKPLSMFFYCLFAGAYYQADAALADLVDIINSMTTN